MGDIIYLAPWFLTLFAGPKGLPTATLFRVWDCLFCEGIKVVFRVILILLRRANLTMSDSLEETMTKVNRALERAIDHNEFLKEAFRLRRFGRDALHENRERHFRMMAE